MIVAIHQPESFPWLGFFHKMYMADVFVILDTVQFEKNNFQNRNKLIFSGESRWLTLPLVDHPLDTKIKDIRINWSDDSFVKKHLSSIAQNYSKHPYFEEVYKFLESLYNKKPLLLSDFNISVIDFFRDKLGIKNRLIKASELDLASDVKGGTEVTLEICKILKATKYLSGSGAREYLDVGRYNEAGIEVCFQNFTHPTYTQKGRKDFISNLSIIDLYMNAGAKSLEIILGGTNSKI